MSIAKRVNARRKDSQHALEKALDAMHATKDERTTARSTYASLLSGPHHVTLNAAERRALDVVREQRAESADRAPTSA